MLGAKEVYMPVQKPIGSFGGSVEAIDKAIKEADAVPSESAEKPKPEEVSNLPKVVHTMRGPLPFAKFKEIFNDVWLQVTDKNYLLAGRIRFQAEIAGFPVVVRSMLRKEEQAAAIWEPAPAAYDAKGAMVAPDQYGERVENQIAHGLRRLLLQLERIGDIVFNVPPLTPAKRDEWLKDTAVSKSLETLGNMDTMFITALLELLNDFESARYYALRENLLNPSKPLSPTTA